MYQGFFINLAKDRDRLQALTQHLAAGGAAERYRRFEAVDGRAAKHDRQTTLGPGALGCWLSHETLLAAHRTSPRHLHILEDDSVLCADPVAELEKALELADAQEADWDILFTDFLAPVGLRFFLAAAEKINLHARDRVPSFINLRGCKFSCTSSYFVNRRSIDKVVRLIEGGWQRGRAIDLVYRDLCNSGRLNVLATMPFLTSISRDSEISNIRGQMSHSQKVVAIYRRAFFKDADMKALAVEMATLIEGANVAPLAGIYMQCLFFSLSDRFVQF